MEKITAKSNQLIKDTKKLITSSKARNKANLFVLEGARLCFDVLNSVYKVKCLFITQKAYDKYSDKADQLMAIAQNSYFISDDIADKLSDTANCQGVFVVCEMKTKDKAKYSNKVIALDNVQDPANVGTVIRTAEALGIGSIIAYNCCDIYNSKTLRASMGSVLRMNISLCDNLEEELLSLRSDGYNIYSTVPDRSAKPITEIDFSLPCVSVIGNEANGVESIIKAMSDALVTIPMMGRAESLNAGMAASIIMWEMLR